VGIEGIEPSTSTLAQRLAKQLGLTFVSEPSTFRGRVFMCEPAPSGREFVRIVEAIGFADQGKAGAVAAMMCLSMGMRCSEVVNRVVRDLDG
jgi:hypothetical protein